MDYGRVLEYSLKVLQWRSGDIKALYRAGVASLQLGDAQTARHYLTQASRGKPNGKKPTTSHLSCLFDHSPTCTRGRQSSPRGYQIELGELIDFAGLSWSNYRYDINTDV